MTKLRPMKKAPRDGNRIMIWRDGDELPFIGYFGNPYAFNRYVEGRYYDNSRDAWIGHEYGLLDDAHLVGWLPLPARKRGPLPMPRSSDPAMVA